VAEQSTQPAGNAADQPGVDQHLADQPGADQPVADQPGFGSDVAAPDEGAAAGPNRRSIIVLLAVGLGVLAIDLLTKQLVLSHLHEGEPKRLIPGVLYLNLIRNSGAAFSFGTNHTWIFPTITLVVIGWIVWMSRRLGSVAWGIAFGLVLGGALGNLADRLFRAPGPMRGAVVDFVSLFSNDGRGFAIFNIADSALSCGVALAILLELLGRHRDGTKQAAAWKSQPEVRD
jgi:signal peptidase II